MKFKGLLVLLLGLAGSVQAQVSYQYTGPQYSAVTGFYTTSMNITGTVTFDAALPANLSDADMTASVLGYTFNDGAWNYADFNSTPIQMVFSTDANGNITDWSVTVWRNPVPTMVGGDLSGVDIAFSTDPMGFSQVVGWRNANCGKVTNGVCSSVDVTGTAQAYGQNLANFGSWSAPPQAVPASNILSLWLLAMLMISVVAFRHRS